MAELKHIGRIRNTGKKCIVAYRTLPGESNACLIVPTENLPDSYHDSIINLVESTAGQDAYEFAEAMARTNFADGSIMLAALHTQGRMIKMPTREIEMLPRPAVSIVLSELNQIIAEQRGLAVDELALDDGIKRTTTTTPSVKSDPSKTTSQSINEPEIAVTETTTETFKSTDEEAKYYRSQADKMSKQAAELRRKAEELVPTKKIK